MKRLALISVAICLFFAGCAVNPPDEPGNPADLASAKLMEIPLGELKVADLERYLGAEASTAPFNRDRRSIEAPDADSKAVFIYHKDYNEIYIFTRSDMPRLVSNWPKLRVGARLEDILADFPDAKVIEGRSDPLTPEVTILFGGDCVSTDSGNVVITKLGQPLAFIQQMYDPPKYVPERQLSVYHLATTQLFPAFSDDPSPPVCKKRLVAYSAPITGVLYTDDKGNDCSLCVEVCAAFDMDDVLRAMFISTVPCFTK